MLPGRPGDAAGHRHGRVVPRRCRAGTRSRSAATTSGGRLDGRPGTGVHPQGRAHLRRARGRAGARRRRFRAAAVASSSTPRSTSSRRSPSTVRRAGSGRASCAKRSAPASPIMADALSHPDRRRLADRAAAAQQHRPHRDRGARRRARRHAVAAHELATTRRSRCRPRRPSGSPCARSRSSPMRPGSTNTIDPLGGALFRRGADRSPRGARLRVFPQDRRAWRHGRGGQAGFPQREIADAAFDLQREIDAGERIVVGVNAFTEGDDDETPILRIDPALERKQVERVRASRPAATARGRGLAGRAQGRRRRPTQPDAAPARAARARATEGELVEALQTVWGDYREAPAF